MPSDDSLAGMWEAGRTFDGGRCAFRRATVAVRERGLGSVEAYVRSRGPG